MKYKVWLVNDYGHTYYMVDKANPTTFLGSCINFFTGLGSEESFTGISNAMAACDRLNNLSTAERFAIKLYP